MTNRLDARARAEQAERMLATGATWQQIADRLGYRSRQAAQQAVARLRNSAPAETVEQVRANSDATLKLIQHIDFGRLTEALRNNDDDRILAYSKEIRATVAERSKLAGAYAPQRTQVDVTVSTDPSAIIAESRERLLAALAEREQRQLPTIAAPILEAEVVE